MFNIVVVADVLVDIERREKCLPKAPAGKLVFLCDLRLAPFLSVYMFVRQKNVCSEKKTL